MYQKRWALFVVLVWVAGIYSVNITTDDYARLMTGEIMVFDAVNQDGVDGVKVFFTVEGTKENIWQTITDYNHFNQIFGQIDMKVIHEDENGARVRASLFNYEYILYHKYVDHGKKMTWRRESGDLNVVSGSWVIESTADPKVQLVLYESYIDAGNRFGNWLAKWGRENRGADTAKKMRHHVEKLSKEG